MRDHNVNVEVKLQLRTLNSQLKALETRLEKLGTASGKANNTAVAQLTERYNMLKKQLDEIIKVQGKLGNTTKKEVGKAKQSYDEFGKSIGNANKKSRETYGIMDRVATAITNRLTYGMVSFGQKAIKYLSSVNSELAKVEHTARLTARITGGGESAFESLRAERSRLAGQTEFDLKQIGELQNRLAKLGYTVNEINSMTEAITNLSRVTGEDLASSADTVGVVLRVFSEDALTATSVVDTMGRAFNSSALTLSNFKEAFTQVAPSVEDLGGRFEDVVSLLSELADKGIRGSRAGTRLRNVYDELSSSTSKASQFLGEYADNSEGAYAMIDKLAKKIGEGEMSLTQVQQLFNKRARQAVSVMIDMTQNGTIPLTEALQKENEERIKNSEAIAEQANSLETLFLEQEKRKSAWNQFWDDILEKTRSSQIGLNKRLTSMIEDLNWFFARVEFLDKKTKEGESAVLEKYGISQEAYDKWIGDKNSENYETADIYRTAVRGIANYEQGGAFEKFRNRKKIGRWRDIVEKDELRFALMGAGQELDIDEGIEDLDIIDSAVTIKTQKDGKGKKVKTGMTDKELKAEQARRDLEQAKRDLSLMTKGTNEYYLQLMHINDLEANYLRCQADVWEEKAGKEEFANNKKNAMEMAGALRGQADSLSTNGAGKVGDMWAKDIIQRENELKGMQARQKVRTARGMEQAKGRSVKEAKKVLEAGGLGKAKTKADFATKRRYGAEMVMHQSEYERGLQELRNKGVVEGSDAWIQGEADLDATRQEKAIASKERMNSQLIDNENTYWQNKIDIATNGAEIVAQTENIITTSMQKASDERIRIINEEKDRRLKVANLTSFQKEQIEKDANNKIKKEQIRMAKWQAGIQMSQAITNVTIATISALTAQPPMSAIPMSIAIGAMGAGLLAQLAGNIASIPKAESGGKIKGKRHIDGGTLIEAEDSEMIMNRNAVSMFEPMLNAMNSYGNSGITIGGNHLANAMSSSNPVWVSVKDINNVQSQVQVKENRATIR